MFDTDKFIVAASDFKISTTFVFRGALIQSVFMEFFVLHLLRIASMLNQEGACAIFITRTHPRQTKKSLI